MDGRVILALDTSCYTTSCALVAADGQARCDLRSLLPVVRGARGLRQAEAVFAHVTRVPALLEEALAVARERHLRVVGVAAAVRPRPPLDSYLPVFRVAEALGRGVAAALRVPFWPVSHQEGHLAAGWEEGFPSCLLAMHVSGGTTELLRLRGSCPWEVESLGWSLDLHAGQFLDRVGVALGFSFPAGAELDVLAGEARGEVSLPVSVRGYRPSFAGPESAAYRLLARGVPRAEVAYAALACVAKALEKLLLRAAEAGEPREALLVGGVVASPLIRRRLCHRLEHPAVGFRLRFPPPELCPDNSVGVGRWAWWRARRDGFPEQGGDSPAGVE